MSYFYYVYGLYLKSDIKLYNSDDLICSFTPDPDIIIKTSRHFVHEFENVDGNFSLCGNRIWFMTEAGSFLIEDGCRIYAAPDDMVSNNTLSSFLMGWCINFLMFQKNIPGIHCSALSYKNKIFLISGFSGAGKSTTSMELLKNGCHFLADDIAFCSSGNNFLIYPGLPLQKMCRDVAESLNSTENLLYIDEEKDKFASVSKENFDPVPGKPSLFFQLEVRPIDNVECCEITGFEKVSVLLRSLFMESLFKTFSYPLNIKNECLRLAGEIRIIRIRRPAGKNTLNEICKIIKNYLEESCQLLQE